MLFVRSFALLLLLSLTAMAEVKPLKASPLTGIAASSSSVAASTPLPAVPLAQEKRPLALWLGIALVVITFHRAFARRQRA